MVNNDEWLGGLEYVPFLREVGRHFTINRMLTFDSVKLRLDREQPMTFLEFNYMILQAYDFLELSRRVGCRAQMGGSDQWGNIVNGIELGRRIDGAELFGVTTPLITTADGTKMGKTAQGAVWLDAAFLSPEETARETFAEGGAGGDLPTLSVGEGMNIAHALTALGFTPSNKEAKRKIAEGAVRLDDVTVNDPGLMLTAGAQPPLKLSLGRKKHALLVR